MNATGLKGQSYTSVKRTQPRNHEQDLEARKLYETRADRRIKGSNPQYQPKTAKA
jgi:hypothetical protein